MASQQQNVTIDSPGFEGINTEESPISQQPGFCLVADNAVVDRFGRIGCRKAFAGFTTAVNITYTPAVGVDSTVITTHRMGNGFINNVSVVIATVDVIQRDITGTLLQTDSFVCKLTTVGDVHELDELTLPTMLNPTSLNDAKIVSFRDKLYVFSAGNDPLVYDGTAVTNLSAAATYSPPEDNSGIIAPLLDGNIVTASYGRLWVTGVGEDYSSIYYSDLLIPEVWYDGKHTPHNALNTGGILNVAEYWPKGTDRIVDLIAHNNALYVFGRNSILIYNNAATGDPAAEGGIFLADTISNLGLVSRDATANIGSDILFVDDSGVRSLGRTIQEKSVPIGDLTYNIRRDITAEISATVDKKSISLSYWPDEDLSVLTFADTEIAYCMEMRGPSISGGSKMTRWTGCQFRRSMYYEVAGEARVLLAANTGDGMFLYDEFLEHTGTAFEFKFESTGYTFGQPANIKYVKQIDYTVVSTRIPTIGHAGWGFSGRLDYSKELNIDAQIPALYGVALFGVDEFGDGLTTIRRYKVNTKGSGETLIVGLRADIEGNSLSLQEINIQTLLGRLN